MLRLKRFVFLFFFGGFLGASGQLENRIFNGTLNHSFPDTLFQFQKLKYQPKTWGIQALHYLRNNEYLENHNPGSTLFGVQLSTGKSFNFENSASKVLIGGMLNVAYGNNYTLDFWPLIQFKHQITPNQQIIFGSIHGATRHQVYEPLYSYELALTNPIEYGIQHLYKNKYWESDIWLDWRNLAVSNTSEQEVISFGTRANINLNLDKSMHSFSIPVSNLIYHQGGENLKIRQPIQNKWNGSLGLRYQYNQLFRVETVMLGSVDFSPQLQTSFKDGHALFTQLLINPTGNHQWVISHFYGEELFSPLGTNLFLSEQIGNPYRFDNYRNFILLRYQYMQSLIPDQCILDFRLEPLWHIEKQQMGFSAALYVKYILGTEVY